MNALAERLAELIGEVEGRKGAALGRLPKCER